MDPHPAAQHWADVWSRAWPRRDVEAIAALYADTAVCHSPAFRQPFLGLAGIRIYVTRDLPPAGADIGCWFGRPMVSGDRAAVEWWVNFNAPDGDHTSAGVTVLRFDSQGQVVDHRDYYNHVQERLHPYEEWRNQTPG